MVIGRLSRTAIQAWQTIAAAMFCLVCYVGQLYACKAVRFRSCYVLFVLHFPVVRLILLYLECDVHIWNSHVLMPVHLFVLHFAVFWNETIFILIFHTVAFKHAVSLAEHGFL